MYGPVRATTIAGVKTLSISCVNPECSEFRIAYFLPSIDIQRMRLAEKDEEYKFKGGESLGEYSKA